MKKLSKNVNRILGKAGFTLVELLVVMAILGILIAVAIGGISIAQKGARENTRLRDVNTVKGLVESYYGTYKRYPAALTPCPSGTPTGIATNASCNSPVTMQQAGFTGVAAQSGPATGATTCAGVVTTASGNITWTIGYGASSSGSSYYLCVSKEDGSPVDFSSQ